MAFIMHNSTYNNDYELDGMINVIAESMASVAVGANCYNEAIDSNNDEQAYCSAPNSFDVSILSSKKVVMASMVSLLSFP